MPQYVLPTVGITADSQLDSLGNFHLHHGGLVVYDFLDGNDDLVDVFLRKELAILESLNHVIDKFLRHLASELCSVIAILHDHGVQIKPLRSRWLIANFDGSEESQLAHNLLAFLQLESRILVVGVQPDTLLEVFNRILGF